jgi:hypothetical protein
VRVLVRFLEAGLVHVPVAVLGAVLVGVGVRVLDVLVVVCGARACARRRRGRARVNATRRECGRDAT